MVLLELKSVSKYFGSLAALNDVSLEINQGELVGLVGPNGSGKTTLFNVVSGFYHPTQGEVIYDGKNITGLRADRIAAMGLIRTFQANILYKEATVLENVIRGAYLESKTSSWQAFFNTTAYRKEEAEISRRAEEMLAFWGLSEVRDVLAEELPHGYQRRLGLTVAQAANPKMLLIDEPVGGMSGDERTAVIEHIKELHKQGVTIVVVEHHVQTVLALSQRVIVLDFGHKIADGSPYEVMHQQNVIEAYLGAEEVA
jgi:branched-chain amino acid transport system ATP-binding protein